MRYKQRFKKFTDYLGITHSAVINAELGVRNQRMEGLKKWEYEIWMFSDFERWRIGSLLGGKFVERTFTAPTFFRLEKVFAKSIRYKLSYLDTFVLRTRNYLAFVFDDDVYLSAFYIGKGTYNMYPDKRFGYPTLPWKYNKLPIDKSQKWMDEYFSLRYEKVKELLSIIPRNSFYDRIINLYGNSIWARSEEILVSFMYKWIMIECIANKEIGSFSVDKIKRFKKKELLSSSEVKTILKRKDQKDKNFFTLNDKIKITIRKLIPDASLEGLEIEHKLRDKIFHSGVTSQIYQMLRETDFVDSVSYLLLKAKINRITDMDLPIFNDEELVRPAKRSRFKL